MSGKHERLCLTVSDVVASLMDVRDDQHKGAPVPRRWRALLQVCQQEVDAMERGPARARQAVLEGVRDGIRPEFRRFLSDLSSDEPGLFCMEDMLRTMHDDPELNGHEEEVLDQFERLVQDGLSGQQLAQEAYGSILVRSCEAQLRQLDGFLRVKAPSERAVVMQRLRNAIADGVSVPAVARELASGQLPAAPRPKTRPLDLDEDLRLPAARRLGRS